MTWNVVHISEADAISNFASVLAQVRAGAEVVSNAKRTLSQSFVPLVTKTGPAFSPNPLL